MHNVLIDTFIVLHASKAAFVEQTRGIQTFHKTLPGFVEGFVYEKQAGISRYNVITTAVWENETAMRQAQQAVTAQYQRQHFNPQEFLQQLQVEAERGVYERHPYEQVVRLGPAGVRRETGHFSHHVRRSGKALGIACSPEAWLDVRHLGND